MSLATSPPVVALHCSASSPRQWDPYARRLAPGVRLIAPALGARPAVVSSGCTLGPAGLDAEAARLWREVGGGPVHLVGHSFGAAVALTMALQRPQWVVSATLFEPILFALLRTGGPADDWHEIISVGQGVAASAARGHPALAAQRFCDYWGGTGAWERMGPSRREAVIGRMDDVVWNFEALFGGAASVDAFARMDLPVQVLVGQRSPSPARRCSEQVFRLCPGASLIRIEGVGHMAPVDSPNRVLPLLPFAAAQGEAREPVLDGRGPSQA